MTSCTQPHTLGGEAAVERRPENTVTTAKTTYGAIAQVGERLLCKQEVAGSSPAGSIDVS